MIIRTEILQESCAKILNAVDSNVLSAVTETLEIKTENKQLSMSVTNREYFVKILFGDNIGDEIHATVNANLFLKLISKVTSETIELYTDEKSLYVKCNGDYKLPLIYEGDKLVELPVINIENVSETFDVDSTILHSIVNYNSKELGKGSISKPIQRLYYVDNEGAITFTTGACVNKFSIDMTSKLLLNDKLVKLFKLFKDTKVKVTVGHNKLSEDTVVTAVRFEAPNITIDAVLSCDDSMVVSFPVSGIRGRADTVYPNTISINKELLMQAVERLNLFNHAGMRSDLSVSIVKLEFTSTNLVVADRNGINREEIPYTTPLEGEVDYSALIDSSDLTKTLASATNQIVTIGFGNEQAFVISEGLVKWVIPECQGD